MAEKRGPGRPPKYEHPRRDVYSIAVDEMRKEMITSAGTADFWYPVLGKIAEHTVAFKYEMISPEDYAERVGEAVRVAAEKYYQREAE